MPRLPGAAALGQGFIGGIAVMIGLPMLAPWFHPAPPPLPDQLLPPLAAGAGDPVFTTYAAPLERSEYLVDEGYHLRFEDPDDRIAQSVPFVPQPAQQLTDEEMLGALRRLPEAFQEVIVLCDVEELTYKEIAQALSIPIGTVMSRLHRGRAMLRSELADSDAIPERRRARG